MAEIAQEKGVTPAQLALAWVLAQGRTSSRSRGPSAASTWSRTPPPSISMLTAEDLARLDELPEAAGTRYDESGMAAVNL